MTPPDWLVKHGGELKLGSDGKTHFVLFNAKPQYALTITPVAGKFGSVIRQTVNGQRLETSGSYITADEAFRCGLEELRKSLGW